MSLRWIYNGADSVDPHTRLLHPEVDRMRAGKHRIGKYNMTKYKYRGSIRLH